MIALMFACDRPDFYFDEHEREYIGMMNILSEIESRGGKLGKKASKVKNRAAAYGNSTAIGTK